MDAVHFSLTVSMALNALLLVFFNVRDEQYRDAIADLLTLLNRHDIERDELRRTTDDPAVEKHYWRHDR